MKPRFIRRIPELLMRKKHRSSEFGFFFIMNLGSKISYFWDRLCKKQHTDKIVRDIQNSQERRPEILPHEKNNNSVPFISQIVCSFVKAVWMLRKSQVFLPFYGKLWISMVTIDSLESVNFSWMRLENEVIDSKYIALLFIVRACIE